MHIELTEMLRCPEPHELGFLVLSTGEMVGRMIRSGLVGCPVCRREYRIVEGIVDFGGRGKREGCTHPLTLRRCRRFSIFPVQGVLSCS